MELENRKKITLGIFILLGLIIFVGVVFYMGTERQLFVSKIKVSAVFHNVEGLNEGNNVWFSGIKVGTVKEVSLASDSLVKATLTINEEAARFIKKDSYATIGSQGLMGNKVITISPGSVNAQSIEEGDELRTKEPIGVEDIFQTVKETADEASNLASNLARISESVKDGNGVLGKLIYDTILTQRIEISMNLIEQSSRNVAQLTSEINKTAHNINNGDGLATRLIQDEEWATDIAASIDSLHKTSAMMTSAGRDLKIFMEKLNQEKGTIQQLLEDSVMANDLHQAIINFEKGTRNLDQVMSTVNNSWLLNLFNRKD